MSRSAWAVVARHWGELSGVGLAAGAGDAVLLERFRLGRDQAAFTALVQAHGPMVLAVCRRIVRDPHAADDAFQAVFLVLARKAGSVRDAERLGPWLHRVAVRVATRAARGAKRRQLREVDQPEALAGALAPAPSALDADQAGLLHAEIDRLPDRDRLPIVLCDLQGLTHAQAAARLGWPVGTVKGRQARARARLRDRLTRRGLAAPLTLISATLATDAQAVLPALLAARTTSVVLNALTGATATVTATAAAALTLARGVPVPMWFSPLKLTALAALLGGGLIATQAGSRSPAHDPTQPVAARSSGGVAPQAPPSDDPFGVAAGAGPNTDPFVGGESDPARASGARPDEPKARRDSPVQAEPGPVTTPPLTPDARANLLAEREEAEVYGELLENELATTHEVIQDLLRRLRQRRLDRLEQADPLDEQGQKRWDQVTATLNSELETHQAVYRKGLDQQRLLRRNLADLDRKLEAPTTEPQRYKPGDVLVIEVLQALPGRPISGERIVRPDGTLSLGFYGEIRVAGLTSREVKEAVIAHLRKLLTDEVLGLTAADEQGNPIAIAPTDSNHVFVDEAGWSGSGRATGEAKIRDLERKLDRMQQELRRLRAPAADPF